MMDADPKTTISPAITARAKWDAQVGAANAQRVLWMVAALLILLVFAVRETYHAHQAVQPKLVPYVLKVDELGRTEALRIASDLKSEHTRIFEDAVKRFIRLARRVTVDESLQSEAINGVFAMFAENDPAAIKYLNEFQDRDGELNPRNPYNRAAKGITVETEIMSALQATEGSWEVEWLETVFDAKGTPRKRMRMRANVIVYMADEYQTDEDAIADNPAGVFIRDYDWTEVKKQEVYE